MRILRRTFFLIAAVLIAAAMCGCAAVDTNNPGGKKPANGIKIEDIDWSVGEGIDDGERYVMLDYTNNSAYTIASFIITFKERADVSEEKKEAYFKDMKKLYELDDDDLQELRDRELTMNAESLWVTAPGEDASGVKCCYYSGYLYVTKAAHFDLVEPDVAEIRYVDGEEIVKVYYDFGSKKYTKDGDTEIAYYWTEKALANVAPKPEAAIVAKDGSDTDKSFGFKVYGWTMKDFNKYVSACREMGYTVNVSEHDGFYSADNADGYNVYLYYYDDDGVMNADVKAPDKNG